MQVYLRKSCAVGVTLNYFFFFKDIYFFSYEITSVENPDKIIQRLFIKLKYDLCLLTGIIVGYNEHLVSSPTRYQPAGTKPTGNCVVAPWYFLS